MGVLAGKRGLVMGVANERSIAWGIAKACAEAGAELAFTYQGDAFGKRLEPLAQSVGSDIMLDVDVTDDASLDTAFAALTDRWGQLDFVIHAIAFSDKSELTGRILDTSRDNFKNSMDISAYSFIEVARRAHPMMVDKGGTLITLSYMGSTRV
ncbi:MAG: SDR family oxidoreductase, partial [Pseudomonadota bacterium]